MAKLFSFSAATFLLLGSTGATFAESANFETNGFPVSLHQAQVTGFADIEEAAPAATLVAAGMPVSPHQLAVLSPRRADSPVQVAAKRNSAIEAATER
jgi:hypothetical protein